jgi:hypothetical protein
MGHVHLHVGALDEAERFYHAALGVEKMVWNYPGALFLAASGPAGRRSPTRGARGCGSGAGSRSDPRGYRVAEYFFNTFSSSAAVSGGLTLPSTISFVVICLPYIEAFSSRSCRSVAPVSAMPAKTPRERE